MDTRSMGSTLRLLALLAVVSSGAFGDGLRPAQDARLAVPGAEEQMRSEKLVREIFKDDYGRREPEAKVALAKKLERQALETNDDPASQFILLREARDMALQGGDLGLALDAMEEMIKRFRVDAAALKSETLNQASQGVHPPEEWRRLVAAFLKLSAEAGAEDQWDTALKAAASAAAAARKAKDIPLVGKVEARVREAADFKGRYEAATKARAILEKKTDDPAANQALGEYLCMAKGDWERGLPYLGRAGDPVLKALALRDSAVPGVPSDQIGVGDGWWELGEKAGGTDRQHLRGRAVHWYAQALPKADGLTKVKLERRLEEAGPPVKGDPVRSGPFDLDARGLIRHWLILGPFPNKEDRGLDQDFLSGEGQYVPSEGREVEKEGGIRLRWAPFVTDSDRVDFFKVQHLGLRQNQENLVVYCACWLEGEADSDLELRIGSDDGYYLWVDQKLMAKMHTHRGATPDNDILPFHLAKGTHLVMIKVDQGNGAYEFMIRVTTPQGDRAPGLKVRN